MADRLRDEHFVKLAEILQSITGIQLSPAKRTMIEGRLRKRMRVHKISDLEEYGRHLFDDNWLETELSSLIDAVTTNKTDFFREPTHFEFLTNEAVPNLLRLSNRLKPRLKIWSAAASSGAEAYTISMVLRQMQDMGSKFDFMILGTDISNEVLEEARTAVYPADMAETIPRELQLRFLKWSSRTRAERFRIAPEIRGKVNFQQMNLMDEAYPVDRDVDIIFCRNVLIYFSRENQARVVKHLCQHLRPGGYLLLGHSESFAFSERSNMTQVSQTVFRRSAERDIGEAA